MNMLFVLTLLAVFVVLVINEVIWRTRKTHGEISRKFVHITVGVYAAFWPFYLSWTQIKLLSLLLIVGVGLSKILKLFRAISSVQRPTWGEFCFAISIGVVALITQNKWIYMAAILQMGLADGLAALIGVRLGKSNSYIIFNHTKSLAGTITFLITSIIILLAYTHFGHASLSALFILIIAAFGSVLENVSVQGLDNLLVPVFVALLLAHH